MSREKQIEQDINEFFDGKCGEQSCWFNFEGEEESCRRCIANYLEEQGYRRQSEGEWIKKEYDIDGEITVGIVCNICGASRVAGLGLAKYCYMCGAKMKGGAG